MIKYEKARLKDIDEIMRLAEEFDKEHFRLVTKHNKKIKFMLRMRKDWVGIKKAYLKKCVRSNKCNIFIARDGEQIVAYGVVMIKKYIPIFRVSKIGYFGDLYVSPQYRGKGISSKLKRLGIKWFKEKGCEVASIGVHWGNEKARKIYERWGFIARNINMYKRI